MIKKYMIRGSISSEDLHFTHKKKAVDAAKRILLSGMKRVVHISKFSEGWSKVNSMRNSFKDIEIWELVNDVPKRTDNMRF